MCGLNNTTNHNNSKSVIASRAHFVTLAVSWPGAERPRGAVARPLRRARRPRRWLPPEGGYRHHGSGGPSRMIFILIGM